MNTAILNRPARTMRRPLAALLEILPVLRAVIDRRMLVNFRVRPDALAKLLPAPFRPKLVRGWGMAGICLIRLRDVRPRGLPAWCGLSSENAAHRIAVEWDEGGVTHEGVFIPRRDTSSAINRLAGGRMIPGVNHAADFKVWESDRRFKVEMNSRDGAVFVRVAARIAEEFPRGSVFESLDEAAEFFRRGAVGWSPREKIAEFQLRAPCACDGLELKCDSWRVEPLFVERVESSLFEDESQFPRGSAEFDNALLMRGIEHEWHVRGRMEVTAE